jgi:uncharacterized protein YjbJ (UPF0337 family)
MNYHVNGIWKRKKDKIKLRFSDITDEDLLFVEGKEFEMFERLRTKLGKTDMEILGIIIES